MASIFTYPHTNISVNALQRRRPVAVESDATTLLAPFTCDRGPENELVAIDSFSDFQAVFGELDYSIPNQRQVLNIGRWLAGGGRVLACRLTDVNSKDLEGNKNGDAVIASDAKYILCSGNDTTSVLTKNNFELKLIKNDVQADSLINNEYYAYTNSEINSLRGYLLTATAKYSGTYYNNLSVIFEAKNNNPGYFDISVVQEKNGSKLTVEKFRNKTFSDFNSIESSSSYIGELMIQQIEFDPSILASFNDKNAATHYAGESATGVPTLISNSDILKEALENTAREAFNTELAAFTNVMSNTDMVNGVSYVDGNLTLTTFKEIQLINESIITSLNSEYKYYIVEYNTETETYRPAEGFFGVTGAEIRNSSNVSSLVGENSHYYLIQTVSEQIPVNIRYVFTSTDYSVNEDELDTPFTEDELAGTAKTKYFREDITISFAGGADVSDDFIYGTEAESHSDSKLYASLYKILSKPLETPFDVMIDPGYPIEIKQQLIELFAKGINRTFSNNGITYKDIFKRDDAFLFLTQIELFGNGRRNRTQHQLNILSDDKLNDMVKDYTNVAIQKQYKKVTDLYSADSGKEVFVPITYDFAYLIPYNDATYGPQWPTAGLTRGIVGGKDTWINEIPTTSEKQANYDNMFNYVEKDSRGVYIMTNLTATTEDTELKFISKSRALLKMKRQLTKIARMYLHEFNDRITKNNLQNKLDNCMSDWIQNRTLSYASVGIQDYTDNDTLTNEELLLTLDIKFNGTVEIISTEFTVE